jgi:hypothetical protein
MTTLLALLVIAALFALLAWFTSNDRFSAGPLPHDRFRDNDAWLFHDTPRLP